MARLYADEDFDFSVVVELRRLGHDVLTIQEDGCGEKSIPDHGIIAIPAHYRNEAAGASREQSEQL
jgi:hypothetical protein